MPSETGPGLSDQQARYDSAGISLKPIPLTPTSATKKKWPGIVALVTAGLAGLIAGFAINSFRDCKAPPAKTGDTVAVTRKAATPMRDGTCERALGEGDLNPDNKGIYDPACGGCGNGIQDPGETAESCPGDFLCGNGKVDWNVKVVKMVMLPGGIISQQVGTYSESCRKGDPNYCEPDCKRTVPRNGRDAGAEGEIEISRANGKNCPKHLVSGDSNRARAYLSNLRQKIWETSETIYSRLVPGGNPYLTDIVLGFKLKVGADGSITVDSITPSCDRESCSVEADLKEILNGTANSGTLDTAVGGQGCSWNFQMRVPNPGQKTPIPQPEQE